MYTGPDSFVKRLLADISVGKRVQLLRRGERVFSQGDPADSVYYIDRGTIKITVGSSIGQEAVLMVLGAGDYFGEGCLTGRSLRAYTATALELTRLLRIEKRSMVRALEQQPAITKSFVTALLSRNEDLNDDLSAHLLHPSEKRLARTLLKLARRESRQVNTEVKIKKVSHELLAGMVGTTRPHITEFMIKFRKMGLIDYKKDILVRTRLLADLVEHD